MRYLAAIVGAVAITAPAAAGLADEPAPPVRPVVVLDPGHGGSNAGAASIRDGLYEKHLTLALAREVRDLVEPLGVDVVLTRNRDRFLTLRERTAIANALSADLFVSIHANATPAHSQRGFETFVLTPEAVAQDARALRSQPVPSRAGMDPALAAVLDDVERSAAVPDAAELAAAIQSELRSAFGADGDRGVRQDSMHVLLGATMPAVLVEVGFIDHPVEGLHLQDPAVRTRICRSLAGAIETSLRDQGKLP